MKCDVGEELGYMKHFTRFINGTSTEYYITSVHDGLIYYGLYIPGYENKMPTACMTVTSYNRLREKEQHGTIYIDSCTYGRLVPCVTQIIGGVIS